VSSFLRKLNTFNDRLAVAITNAVGTMWCAYAFAILALISLPDAIHAGTAAIISWIAQTFLQLVLLSIIIVGQNIAGERTEGVIRDTHDVLLSEFDFLRSHLGAEPRTQDEGEPHANDV
jgi:hypothetical protein